MTDIWIEATREEDDETARYHQATSAVIRQISGITAELLDADSRDGFNSRVALAAPGIDNIVRSATYSDPVLFARVQDATYSRLSQAMTTKLSWHKQAEADEWVQSTQSVNTYSGLTEAKLVWDLDANGGAAGIMMGMGYNEYLWSTVARDGTEGSGKAGSLAEAQGLASMHLSDHSQLEGQVSMFARRTTAKVALTEAVKKTSGGTVEEVDQWFERTVPSNYKEALAPLKAHMVYGPNYKRGIVDKIVGIVGSDGSREVDPFGESVLMALVGTIMNDELWSYDNDQGRYTQRLEGTASKKVASAKSLEEVAKAFSGWWGGKFTEIQNEPVMLVDGPWDGPWAVVRNEFGEYAKIKDLSGTPGPDYDTQPNPDYDSEGEMYSLTNTPYKANPIPHPDGTYAVFYYDHGVQHINTVDGQLMLEAYPGPAVKLASLLHPHRLEDNGYAPALAGAQALWPDHTIKDVTDAFWNNGYHVKFKGGGEGTLELHGGNWVKVYDSFGFKDYDQQVDVMVAASLADGNEISVDASRGMWITAVRHEGLIHWAVTDESGEAEVDSGSEETVLDALQQARDTIDKVIRGNGGGEAAPTDSPQPGKEAPTDRPQPGEEAAPQDGAEVPENPEASEAQPDPAAEGADPQGGEQEAPEALAAPDEAQVDQEAPEAAPGEAEVPETGTGDVPVDAEAENPAAATDQLAEDGVAPEVEEGLDDTAAPDAGDVVPDPLNPDTEADEIVDSAGEVSDGEVTGIDPKSMNVGDRTNMTYTLTDGTTGDVDVTFVREDNDIFFFDGPNGEFGLGERDEEGGTVWVDSEGQHFAFADGDALEEVIGEEVPDEAVVADIDLEAPAEGAPTTEAPAEDTPVEEAPTDDAPEEGAPSEDTPEESAPEESEDRGDDKSGGGDDEEDFKKKFSSILSSMKSENPGVNESALRPLARRAAMLSTQMGSIND